MVGTRLVKLGSVALVQAILATLCGCVGAGDSDTSEDEPIREARQDWITFNSLLSDALSNDALSKNAPSIDVLSTNPLSSSALSANPLSGDPAGVQLMKYAVRCALPPPSCVDVATPLPGADLPPECDKGRCHFCGTLSLAPQWEKGPLAGPMGERLVSACLLAHVNSLGAVVKISARDAMPGFIPPVVPPEATDFPSSEAAFYGNIFRVGPVGEYEKYVCNAGAVQTPPGRTCGLGPVEASGCEMTFTGSCFDVNTCTFLDAPPNSAVGDCKDPLGASWKEVITIFDESY